jgi:FKBP-type peptidyl-prolyl cis-trans isomerase
LKPIAVLAVLALAVPAAARAQSPAPAPGAGPTGPEKPPAAGIAKPPAAATKPLAAPAAKADPLRSIGLSIAQQLKAFELSPAELDQVLKGIRDGVTGKATFDAAAMQPAIQTFAQSRFAAAAAKEKAASAGELDKAAKEKGAVKTASGLVYVPVKEGTGAKPVATDKVKVHYRGTLANGKEFDSSYSRGQPAEFPLDQVIKCWTEGLQMMKVGGKAKLVCPASIAYGEQGRPPVIPGNAVLFFDVELLDIVK